MVAMTSAELRVCGWRERKRSARLEERSGSALVVLVVTPPRPRDSFEVRSVPSPARCDDTYENHQQRFHGGELNYLLV